MAEKYFLPPHIYSISWPLTTGNDPIPSPSWVRLNRLHADVDLLCSTMHKFGLVPSANCKCGAEKQTADHILAFCLLNHPPNGTFGLVALYDDTVNGLETTAPASDDTISPNKEEAAMNKLVVC